MAGRGVGMVVHSDERGMSVPASSQGAVATSMASAIAEAKGRMEMARHFPRDERRADSQMIRTCQNPRFAELAIYSYRRGKTVIEGSTIKFAREAARAWGNIAHGFEILDRDVEWCTVRGFAFDMENNLLVQQQARFRMLQQRKRDGQTVWEMPDERDAREKINSMGARCQRNAILSVLPEYVREEWMDVAFDTLKKAAEGDIDVDRDTSIRQLIRAFDGLDVSADRLIAYLGHPLEEINGDELTALRQRFSAIKNGEAKAAEVFPMKEKPRPTEAEIDAYAGVPGSSLGDDLKKGTPPPPPPPAEGPPSTPPPEANGDPTTTAEEDAAFAAMETGEGGSTSGESGGPEPKDETPDNGDTY